MAHATVRAIDATAAVALPGVAAAITAAEVAGLVKPMRADYDQAGFAPTDWPAIATTKVRHVGEIVAVVLATDPYVAEDAAAQINVDYEPLPAVVEIDDALAPDAPKVHDTIDENVFYRGSFKTDGFDTVFDAADFVVAEEFRSARIAAVPIEPRGCIAQYDPGLGSLVLWLSSQIPHIVRTALSELLDLPETGIRVIAPDVGGGFGMKGFLYPEELLACALARKLGRAMKWTGDRLEDLLASVQARDHIDKAELAVNKDGVIQALRVNFLVNVGAYAAFPFGSAIEAGGAALMMPGPYRLSHYCYEAAAVATNICPAGAYRGVGQPAACFAMEGLMDRAARELGIDRAELRRRNILQASEFPYVNVMGVRYDTGSYAECLDRALEIVGYENYRRHQPASREADGICRGIGIACVTEHTAQGAGRYRARGMRRMPGFDGAVVKLEPDGSAVAYLSQATQGQGHLTTFAQIVADQLGLDIDDVTVVEGDTTLTPYGSGTIASRAAVVAGGAVVRASNRVRDKMLRIAGHVLEVGPEDLEMAAGAIRVRGAIQLRIGVREIAAIAHSIDNRSLPDGESYGLEATDYYDPPHTSITNATHVACVAVDSATGLVTLERYVVVHDCGRMINPMVVEGQIRGGIVQGVGQALTEQVIHDRDGQMLTANLMDYALPTALDVPGMDVTHIETPSLDTVGGFKGVGEGGTIGAVPAVANAVADALAGIGASVNRLPLKPDYILGLIGAGNA